MGLFDGATGGELLGFHGVGIELEERVPLLRGGGAKARHVVEPESGDRRRAKPVFEFAKEGVDFVGCGGIAEPVVHFQAQRRFWDVVFGKAGIVGELHPRFEKGGLLFFLERFDGPFKKFAIEMKTDG